MKARVYVPVIVAGALFALGAGIGQVSTARQAPVMATAAPLAPAIRTAPVAPAVTLPEISVSPSAEERAAALADPYADESPFVTPTDAQASKGTGGGTLVRRASFQMPYYSFGKVMPRVSRE